MRTFLLLFISILVSGTLLGQISHSEDFESYNVGDGISEVSPDFWELWPQNPANPPVQDATITDEQAADGNQSLELRGGQDVDVIVVFGGEQYTSGAFSVDFDIFIPTGRNSYLNFQGSDMIGTQGNWVLQCYFEPNGTFRVQDSNIQDVFVNAYPQNQWMNVRLDINLTENLWRMFINDQCLGSFTNEVASNQIYAMNLYPNDGNSIAYVDNLAFNHDPNADAVEIALDGFAFGGLDLDAGIGRAVGGFYGIANTSQNFAVNVRNTGTEVIESFTMNLDGAGLSISEDVTETIAPGEYISVPVDQQVTFNEGLQLVQYTLGNINGVADDNTCNNSTPLVFIGFVPADNKKVFVEESTGRGCTWCPRGHVYMNYMADKYPDHFVGVAVHNNAQGLDPMTNEDWDAGLAPIPWQPGIWFERDTNIMHPVDPNLIERDFVNAVQAAPILSLEHGAQYDADTRELRVQVTTDFFFSAIRANTRLLVGLTENGVQGFGAGYAQVNAYSGGGEGPMGGYEDRPNPVPADQMIYNDVARMVLSGDGLGLQNAYQDVEDKSIIHTFATVIPDEWNVDNMHIVSAFIGPDGRAFNAQKTTIDEAVAYGYSTTIDPVLDQGISVFPNPTTGLANVTLEFENPTDVIMEVTDGMGKVISQENLGTITTKTIKSFDGTAMSAGVYYLSFRSGTEMTIKKLVITE